MTLTRVLSKAEDDGPRRDRDADVEHAERGERAQDGERAVRGGDAIDSPARPLEIHVGVWPDAVVEKLGHDPRSSYVETFWLPILGPSTVLLLRKFATGLEAETGGFSVCLEELALALGIGGHSGRNSPIRRTLDRCVRFGMGRWVGRDTIGVRRKLPPLARRQLVRLPDSLQRDHVAWTAASRGRSPVDDLRERARRLALSQIKLGAGRHDAEERLLRWRVHPALAHESIDWACREAASVTRTTAHPGAEQSPAAPEGPSGPSGPEGPEGPER